MNQSMRCFQVDVLRPGVAYQLLSILSANIIFVFCMGRQISRVRTLGPPPDGYTNDGEPNTRSLCALKVPYYTTRCECD